MGATARLPLQAAAPTQRRPAAYSPPSASPAAAGEPRIGIAGARPVPQSAVRSGHALAYSSPRPWVRILGPPTRFDPMLPALRPHRRLPVACLRRLLCTTPSSSGTGKNGDLPVDAAAMAAAAAKARAEAEARARAEAYKKVQNFDWSSGADWKTAANILFTVPPKRKEFGLDFHLVQLFFACMPSLAVYLVAQYARSEIKRMEAEAEEKRKKDEESEKQKQLEEESAKKDADSMLLNVLDRLDTLEVVVKEIVDDKRKPSSPDSRTKEEVANKDKASTSKASDSKNVASQ